MEKVVFNIDPCTFTGSAIVIGILLTREFSTEELDSVGNWLQLVGIIMQTYASQVATLDTTNNAKNNNKDDIETLKKAFQKIQEKLNKLE